MLREQAFAQFPGERGPPLEVLIPHIKTLGEAVCLFRLTKCGGPRLTRFHSSLSPKKSVFLKGRDQTRS